ncbi:MAG: hypothetical protein KDG51_12790 [Calditrichaeota bacterium]|nr:hypothetical protein [Calditrichota bacterium]
MDDQHGNTNRTLDVMHSAPTIFIAGILILLMLLTGCAQQARSGKAGSTVLFNSFESARDTTNWYWTGTHSFSSDVPPGGGGQALEVSGGNIFPIGTFITQPLRYGGYFTLQCWGKIRGNGGYVELATISDHEVSDAIQAEIIEPQWQFVRASDTLYCPPNKSLMLTLQAGMVRDGQILVDLIEIKKIASAGNPPPERRRLSKK